jgi:transposase
MLKVDNILIRLEEVQAITRSIEQRRKRRLTFAEKMRLVNLALHYGPSEAARELEVSRETVYLWLGRYEEGGSENLRSRPRGKSEPRTVTPEVHERLMALKKENPKRSAAKVARLYQEECGLKVHRGTVWAKLKKGGHRSSH